MFVSVYVCKLGQRGASSGLRVGEQGRINRLSYSSGGNLFGRALPKRASGSGQQVVSNLGRQGVVQAAGNNSLELGGNKGGGQEEVQDERKISPPMRLDLEIDGEAGVFLHG